MTYVVTDAQYRMLKKCFDDNPLDASNEFHVGETWELFHYIKMNMIERLGIDLWKPKNQFELAILLQNYHNDHICEMNKWVFPVQVEFFQKNVDGSHGQYYFDYQITAVLSG